ncbi:MAG: hypothetical protein MZW92_70730 [Comamonadaceae bacterium]|nr:hypothetical protein [Comamonadaceae bacterium]
MQRSLFLALIVREWRHHPWRHGVALLAVALGVALACSVHLINNSALAEFSAAVRAANGEPDLDAARPARRLRRRAVRARGRRPRRSQLASPVLEIDTYARRAAAASAWRCACWASTRLLVARRWPRPCCRGRPSGEDRLAFLDPDAAFLNAAARDQLGAGRRRHACALQSGRGWQRAARGRHAWPAGGAPLVVMDIAGAQQHFGSAGPALAHRPAPGARHRPRGAAGAAGAARRRAAVPADEAEQRVSQPLARLPRQPHGAGAGGAVRRRLPGVLGGLAVGGAAHAVAGAAGRAGPDGARARGNWCWPECALLGAAGSVIGLAAGHGAWRRRRCACWPATWAAATSPASRRRCSWAPAARWSSGCWAPRRRWSAAGVPARQAERIAPALALKGLGTPASLAPPAVARRWRCWLLGAALALRAAGRRPAAGGLCRRGGAAVRRRGAGAGRGARAAGRACRPCTARCRCWPCSARASSAAPPPPRWPAWWPAWRCRWR